MTHTQVTGFLDCICYIPLYLGFPSDSAVKNLSAMQKTQDMWVQSLDLEDPLEEGMATHFSVLAWRIPWMEEPDRLPSLWGQEESDTTEAT